ncbi:MAG: CoA transferase [Verrucomicrobia bacterium]|nr:CoA transferase [Verrucomicrobiota bacterium]
MASALLLEGVRVLDLSRVLAGPYCTMLLGDLGADVVKVESPGRGDDTRHWGPPFVGGESAYFLSANRNKRSITADFGNPEDLARVRRLAAQADVVIENFRRGTLAKFGLDAASLRRDHPRLVYASITGFGPGPDADLPGYDFLVQARGGVMGITGDAESGPRKVGVAVADIVCGLFAAQSIAAALYRRERTGVGASLEIPLFETQLAWLANRGQEYLVTGQDSGRLGNAHPTIVPYQTFETADQPIALAVGNDGQFRALCEALAQPAWADDPRFASNPARVRHRDVLVPLLQAEFARRPAAEWLARIQAAGVPCGPVNALAEVFADPHLLASGMLQSVPHPSAGDLRLLASPLQVNGERPPIRRPPPRHGEHAAEFEHGEWP